MSLSEGVNLDGRKDEEELRGVEGGETLIRIYCILFSINGNKT